MKILKFTLILIITFGFTSVINFAFAQNNYDQTNPNQTAPTDIYINGDAQSTSSMQMHTSTATTEKFSEIDLKMAMRKLWEDHIVFTRNYIISALANLKDIDAVTQRLLKNQDDIGAAIKPFYGDDAGNKLAKLLREHIMIATKVVKAAKANNKDALNKAQTEWTANANEIATFLSSANPNWNKEDLLAQLQVHLDLTTKETSARIKKNWQEDIAAYDSNHNHMLMFSDVLVDGIAKQFPEKIQR